MNENDPQNDDELETMLATLSPEERDALLEEHRQLEKDLLRLADPLPPADFVHRVMEKVATAPAPAPAPKEIALAALIMVSALAAGVLAFVSQGAGFEGLALTFKNLFVHLRFMLVGLGSALEAIWHTAAVPLAVALMAMLFTSVAALKKIGTEAKAVS